MITRQITRVVMQIDGTSGEYRPDTGLAIYLKTDSAALVATGAESPLGNYTFSWTATNAYGYFYIGTLRMDQWGHQWLGEVVGSQNLDSAFEIDQPLTVSASAKIYGGVTGPAAWNGIIKATSGVLNPTLIADADISSTAAIVWTKMAVNPFLSGSVVLSGSLSASGGVTCDTVSVSANVSGLGAYFTTISASSYIGLPSGATAWTDDGTEIYPATLTRKVGIGTTSPTVKLHVYDSLGIGGLLVKAGDGGTGTRIAEFQDCAGADALYISGARDVVIDKSLILSNQFSAKAAFSSYTPDGLYGASALPCSITTPGGTNRKVLFGYTDDGNGGYSPRIGFAQPTAGATLISATASIGLEVTGNFSIGAGASNATAITIDQNLHVGIGTTTPSATLHVVGSGIISGTMTVAGAVTATTISASGMIQGLSMSSGSIWGAAAQFTSISSTGAITGTSISGSGNFNALSGSFAGPIVALAGLSASAITGVSQLGVPFQEYGYANGSISSSVAISMSGTISGGVHQINYYAEVTSITGTNVVTIWFAWTGPRGAQSFTAPLSCSSQGTRVNGTFPIVTDGSHYAQWGLSCSAGNGGTIQFYTIAHRLA